MKIIYSCNYAYKKNSNSDILQWLIVHFSCIFASSLLEYLILRKILVWNFVWYFFEDLLDGQMILMWIEWFYIKASACVRWKTSCVLLLRFLERVRDKCTENLSQAWEIENWFELKTRIRDKGAKSVWVNKLEDWKTKIICEVVHWEVEESGGLPSNWEYVVTKVDERPMKLKVK